MCNVCPEPGQNNRAQLFYTENISKRQVVALPAELFRISGAQHLGATPEQCAAAQT